MHCRFFDAAGGLSVGLFSVPGKKLVKTQGRIVGAAAGDLVALACAADSHPSLKGRFTARPRR
jgi:hypothetical protein